MRDLKALLAACRVSNVDPEPRRALADRIQDDDGHTPACDAALRLECERCGVPDYPGRLARTLRGGFTPYDDVRAMNSSVGYELFGDDYPEPIDARLVVHHDGTRWRLICPGCKQAIVAAKAWATRRANRPTTPGLFDGAD